ncbi:hypothetical protein [Paraflavitalea speifideaquila]|uniref:hypothetical protein n=1 Tax=Paraflavitalea speifideaquila TaxID=3076558 RepID=UPI0028EE03A1|nr:hypothetical protein [Paraflavitalea speifideiaquila]
MKVGKPPYPAKAPQPGAPTAAPAPPAAVSPATAPVPGEPATPPAPPAPRRRVDDVVAVKGTATVSSKPVALAGKVQGIQLEPGSPAIVSKSTGEIIEVTVEPRHVQATGNVLIMEGPIGGPVETTVRARKAELRNVKGTGEVRKTTLMSADLIEIRPVTAVHVTGTANVAETPEVLAEIKNTTTRQELEQLTIALREKGYTLTLNNVNFDNGELVSMEGSISNGSERGNFSGDHFKTLTVSVHKNNGKRYFLIGIRGGTVSFQQ